MFTLLKQAIAGKLWLNVNRYMAMTPCSLCLKGKQLLLHSICFLGRYSSFGDKV